MNIKSIFLSWEKLRLFYNLVLLAVFVLITVSSLLFNDFGPPEISILKLLIHSAFLAFVANLFYFAGPLFESYLSWLDVQFSYQRHLIFISGLLISIVIESAYLSVALSPF